MQALAVTPGDKDSLRLMDVADPARGDGPVLVETLSVGLCGTDVEIVGAQYGESPPGQDYLVLGHENLGRVLEAPEDSGLVKGDLVVGIVRRPDPEPCKACASGEWDMCLNGNYTEHGIKGLDGFAREHWRADPEAMVKLDPGLEDVGVLLEPTTIVAKAWEQVHRIGQRAFFDPRTAVVTGAGPVGLLAAMMGIQQGLEVHVFDIVTDGPKPQLVHDLGATYHSDPLPTSGIKPEVLIECTGVTPVILDALACRAQDAITCLTGVSGTGKQTPVDVGALNRKEVLMNGVVFGSVNANRRHYDAGAQALAKADPSWLRRLISRRMSLENFAEAFKRQPEDVKVVLDLARRGSAGLRVHD
ncbi:glucose 1-dehydrogenase [Pseudarthrobacter enclensis]|uniref:glucose 1-dehydrogenase n=1 Tax=Pseudarthrobacter enclensis TaxID=993070 RepID=UPI003EE33050